MTDLIYAAAAGIYWDLGWRGIIPVDPADKGGVPKGFTGHDGIDVTRENLDWFIKSKPSYNIGLRQPDDAIGIDVDDWGAKRRRHHRRSRETLGKLPYSPRSTSRDDGISGIRVYRIPPGVELVGEIGLPQTRASAGWNSSNGITATCSAGRRGTPRPAASTSGSASTTSRWPTHPNYPGDIPDLPAAWLEAFRKPERNGADLGDQPAEPRITWMRRSPTAR